MTKKKKSSKSVQSAAKVGDRVRSEVDPNRCDAIGADTIGSAASPASSQSLDGADGGAGYFAYEGLDRVLHEKARLGILTALRTRSTGLLFGELKELCSLTDGNLSRHLSVLQEAGLVDIVKAFRGAKPQTWAMLTKGGKKAFDAYLEELQRVIQDASIRVVPEDSRSKGQLPPGVAPA